MSALEIEPSQNFAGQQQQQQQSLSSSRLSLPASSIGSEFGSTESSLSGTNRRPSSSSIGSLVDQDPPRPRTPPHRKVPAHRPIKGILKPAPSPQAKFNFKRDILNPFSNKLGYAAIEESPLGAVVGAGGGSVGQGVQAAAGWVGSAWKRWGAVAVAEKAKLDGHLQSNSLHSSSPAQSGSNPTPSVVAETDRATSIHKLSSTYPLSSQYYTVGPAQSTSPSHSQLHHLPSASATTPAEPVENPLQTVASVPSVQPLNHPQTNLSISTLKKVHFTMSDLKVVYPISNSQPPSYDQVNKIRINQARRLLLSNRNHPYHPQCLDGNSDPQRPLAVNGWSASTLELYYDECCRTREEGWGIMKIREIMKQSAPDTPKTIDLGGIQLNRTGPVEVLGDLLSVDFGLRSLNLAGCGLEDAYLKPILHGLLISGTLPTISLANNRKIRSKGWKMIAVFVKKAKALRHLDLSDNSLDKRSIEYLVQALAGHNRKDDNLSICSVVPIALNPSPSPGQVISTPPLSPGQQRNSVTRPQQQDNSIVLGSSEPTKDVTEVNLLFPQAPLLQEKNYSAAHQALSDITNSSHSEASNLISLRLDNCNLKSNQLDSLAYGIRLSKLKHISLRKNKINNLGAVSLAVMIRDWPTQFGNMPSNGSGNMGLGSKADEESLPYQPLSPRVNAKFESSNSVTARQQTNELFGQPRAPRASLSLSSPPTSMLQQASPSDLDRNNAEHSKDRMKPEGTMQRDLSALVQEEMRKANEQRLKLKAKIDGLPTVGCLLTLDVKNNELRSSDVFYLAQVLKKNRTLKVLNLAENRIDWQGLMYLADALRYNTCLETLDLSKNPSCSVNLEGLLALRTTCTINTTLKRVFLSQTELSSQGAIALAEFLPEMNSLIHLDLTENYGIDIAGVMALAVSVKMNRSLRCLDINIPPNDPDFSRLSQDILKSCVRNTELAQQEAEQRGAQLTISQPMLKSTVVKALSTQQQENLAELIPTSTPQRRPKAKANNDNTDQTELVASILDSAEEIYQVLKELINEDERRKIRLMNPEGAGYERRMMMVVEANELVSELLDHVVTTRVQLREIMSNPKIDDGLKDRAMAMDLRLQTLLEYADLVYKDNNSAVELSSEVSIAIHHPSRAPGHTKIAASAPVDPVDHSASGTDATVHHNKLDSSRIQESGVAGDPAVSSTLSANAGDDKEITVHGHEKENSSKTTPPRSLKLSDGHHRKNSSISSINSAPRSPVGSQSRSLTIEEGEVFRKGTVLGTAETDNESTRELSGETLKESILVTEVKRTMRPSIILEEPITSPKTESDEEELNDDASN